MQPTKKATLSGHKDSIYALAPAQDARYFFSADGRGQIAQWDLENPELGNLIAQIPSSVYAMCHLPASQELIIGQNFAGLHQINYVSKLETRSLRLTDTYIFDIKKYNNMLLVALADGTISVVDLDTWIVLKQLKHTDKSARKIAFHPQKQEFSVGYSDNFIRVFDLDSLQLKYEVEAHTNSVFSLAYSPDGAYLLSGSRDARLKIWRVAEDYTLHQSIVAHLFAINDLAYSANGLYFATASMDKSIKIWEASSFRLLKVIDKARHAGHGNSVNVLLWSSFHDYLLSAGDDKTAGVWDLGI